MWAAVELRFRRFCAELRPTPDQFKDAMGKAVRIAQHLERHYNGSNAIQPPIFAVGSWGKGTQGKKSNDIDIMALFDWSVYERFEAYTSNGQSALLQEIKSVLEIPYSQTRIRGDGQVVVVDFNTIAVELVPVFSLTNEQFLMPDTNNGGSWRIVDPKAQIDHIAQADLEFKGNVRNLCRIIKCWKAEKDIKIKSFLIELLVVEFLKNTNWSKNGYFWYDWLIRDYFKFMMDYSDGYATIPGTADRIELGSDWAPKVENAIKIAELACEYERLDCVIDAGIQWQKIFGTQVPMKV